jgi:hypothetical protein
VTGAGRKVRRGDVDLGSGIRETSFDEDNHFMLLEVDDKQVSFQAITETGTVVDSGSIKQAWAPEWMDYKGTRRKCKQV